MRFLVLTIEAIRPGAFEWVLLESFDDVPEFTPVARSAEAFATYQQAWQAGCAALESGLSGPRLEILDEGE